jgi:stage V sporulation protein AF
MPEIKPPMLEFIGPPKPGRLPLLFQFIVAEIGVDLMRLAAVHTPSPLATAMSLISAILIGDIAVKTGLFINEVILYMSVAAIGMFATPSYELGLANRLVRLLLIFAVALFKLPGLVAASTIIIVMLATQRSFNRPYLWPFIPFDAKGMFSVMLRVPFLYDRNRPEIIRPNQKDKLPQ